MVMQKRSESSITEGVIREVLMRYREYSILEREKKIRDRQVVEEVRSLLSMVRIGKSQNSSRVVLIVLKTPNADPAAIVLHVRPEGSGIQTLIVKYRKARSLGRWTRNHRALASRGTIQAVSPNSR